MFGKAWQRLAKEALLYIYRQDRFKKFALDLPVYYFSFNGDIDLTCRAIQSLQAVPEIPWPDDNCIILAEDMLAGAFISNPHSLVWMIRIKNFRALSADKNSEFIYSGAINLLANGRFVIIPWRMLYFVHYDDFPAIKYEGAELDAAARHHATRLNDCALTIGERVDTEGYAEYIKKACYGFGTARWVAYELGSTEPEPGLAADFLGYLSNLAIPCHYMVRSRFTTGFGTSSIRRITAEKPIFTIVGYDRLYRQYESVNGGEPMEIAPHFRRGHIRHHWKLAGVNRKALPDDPAERIKIVHQRNVPRTYIHPTWIGDRVFTADGTEYEVQTGEIPLRQLNREL